MVMKIVEGAIASDDLPKFFRTLYAAVHHWIDHRVYSDNPCVSPTRSLSFVGENCLTPENTRVPARVFKKDKHIHTLYDTMKLPVMHECTLLLSASYCTIVMRLCMHAHLVTCCCSEVAAF
jgi:hypothetical protein